MYVDTSLIALKELKVHDLLAINERLGELSGRIDKTFALSERSIDLRFMAQKELSEKSAIAAKDALVLALEAAKEAVAAALQGAKEAVTKAEAATEKRFDSVNEFRATLSDLMQTMMPRTEVESSLKSQAEKIDSAVARLDKAEGQRGISASTMTTMIAVAAILVSALLGANVFSGHGSSSPTPEIMTSKRMDDMISRLDSLSTRMNSVNPPP
jgi:hypothetical protein